MTANVITFLTIIDFGWFCTACPPSGAKQQTPCAPLTIVSGRSLSMLLFCSAGDEMSPVGETGLYNRHYTMSERPVICYTEHSPLWIWRGTHLGMHARITQCNDGKHFSFRLTFKNKNVLPFTDRVVVSPQQRISLFSVVRNHVLQPPRNQV